MRTHQYFFTALLLLLAFQQVPAQTVAQLSLDDANRWSAQNFPLLKQKQLAHEKALAGNSNLGSNFLPQLNFSAQASWQSAVTEVPTRIPIPGLEFPSINKDQYRALLDINQLVYDGGITRNQKELNELQALLKEEELNVALQQLREKINSLYLSVLLLDEQRKQTALNISDIDAGISKVDAQVKNGTAYRSNLAMLQSEKLKAKQRDMELQNDREGLINVLSLYTGKNIAPAAVLVVPPTPALFAADDISRPELQYYHLQDSLTQQQMDLVDGKLRPRLSLFANTGYGRPGLDMMKNEFSPFITTGVRLNWNISGFYTSKKERDIYEISRREIQTQQENFLQNTKSQLVQQQSNIKKLNNLLATDKEIIALKTQVKDAAKSQLENGVITASDYLREVNAEDQARQAQILHQLQLLQALLNYSTIAGK